MWAMWHRLISRCDIDQQCLLVQCLIMFPTLIEVIVVTVVGDVYADDDDDG